MECSLNYSPVGKARCDKCYDTAAAQYGVFVLGILIGIAALSGLRRNLQKQILNDPVHMLLGKFQVQGVQKQHL